MVLKAHHTFARSDAFQSRYFRLSTRLEFFTLSCDRLNDRVQQGIVIVCGSIPLVLALLLAPNGTHSDYGRHIGVMSAQVSNDGCIICGDLLWDGFEDLGFRCHLGGGPQVRLELCVSLLPWQSVSEEKTSQVVDRIAWLCTPMNRDLDAGTHDSADRPSFSPELLGSAFHRRASV